MGAVIASEGARGDLVRTLQECLVGQGFPAGTLDGRYGFRTAAAVQTFQVGEGLPVTGEADAGTWTAITSFEPPSVERRALQLIASFDERDFTLANGNCDGAGITWGIAGFTLRGGEIAAIVHAALAASPALVEEAFGEETGELLDVLGRRAADQVAWADRHSAGSYKMLLAEPWRSHFRAFGANPRVQEIQLAWVHENRFGPASRTAAELGLESELGVALCFDVQLRDGGVKRAAAEEVAAKRTSGMPEPKLRELLANAVAGLARADRRSEARDRALALARGAGTVRGAAYVMRSWGLDETPAARRVAARA